MPHQLGYNERQFSGSGLRNYHHLARCHSMKAAAYCGDYDTARGLVAATLRHPHKVARDQHKGFDHRALIEDISRRFDVESIEGFPAIGLPPALSPTVGIVARSRVRH